MNLSILYDYDLEIHNQYLASFLMSIQEDRSGGTIFKLAKIAIIKIYSQFKMIHLVKFRTNLTIDELCHFFSLSIYDIRYTPSNRVIHKQSTLNRWANLKHDPNILNLFNISQFLKQFDETNVCDMFNLERAYRYNPKVWQLIDLYYFKRDDIYEYFTHSDEFNLNELLIKLKFSHISIFDLQEMLFKFGEHFKKIIIVNFEEIVPITFIVRRKVNLILSFIERYCPKIEEILIDHVYYPPLDSCCNIHTDFKLEDLCTLPLSIYAGKNEVERFLQLLHNANIMFMVRKIKNFKLKCNKDVRKLMKLNFMSKLTETLNLIRGLLKSENFQTIQIAFEWHQDSPGNSWKGIPISKSYQAYISYMFTEINLLKYYNLFDLLLLDEVFYDIKDFDLHLIYNQILLFRPILINPTTGEFNLNEILLKSNLSKIRLKLLVKIVRIFGSFIKIFVGSKNLIEFPMINNSISILKIIKYYLYKYCKNLEKVKFDDTILESIQFIKVKRQLRNLLVTNYNANDLFELFNRKSELQTNNIYSEINIKKFLNLTESDFVNTLRIKNLTRLILNSNYMNIRNWAFLQDTVHLKPGKFNLDNTFEIKLYHLTYNPYQFHTACDQFLDAIFKFFKQFNLNAIFILNLNLIKCTIDNFKIFNYVNLERIVFNKVNLSSTNLIALGKCCSLKSITFLNCDKLNDDYLIMFIKDLKFNLKEINIDNCLITDAFFYRYAEHEIGRYGYRIFMFWFSLIQFSFKNCPQVTIDWEHEEFVISNDDTYISMMDEFEDNNREEDIQLIGYDEQDLNVESSDNLEEEIGYDFYN